MRVHELAKKLKFDSKEFLEELKELGVKAKSHMSNLDDETVKIILDSFAEVKEEKAKKKAKKPKKVEKKPAKKKKEKPAKKRAKKKPEEVPQEVVEEVEEEKEEEVKVVEEEVVAEEKKVAKDTPKIIVKVPITLGELAKEFDLSVSQVIKFLMSRGILATINQRLKADTILMVAGEFEKNAQIEEVKKGIKKLEGADKSKLVPRPPIVTVMGHVDHGKTALLDAIRKTNVVAKEAGGITQHIGASRVVLDKGDVIFLDTPGHKAFTAMRARGAQVTDVVVLVVAADDGVMPQTVEAIDHAKAAGVPILVAINKMDKPDAKSERVMQQLMEYELIPEDLGGKTIFVKVSALEGTGLDELLEMLLLEAEMLELKANPDAQPEGIVIEARVDKWRGAVATVIVRQGTLKLGDNFVCGYTSGKVKALVDDNGEKIKEAKPAIPVEILGFSKVPAIGDVFEVVSNEREARGFAQQRVLEKRDKEMVVQPHISLDDLYTRIQSGEIVNLNIILKGDVQGSLEALGDSLESLSTKNVKLHVIHSGVGDINEGDIMLASASNAIVIGFNVKMDPRLEKLKQKEEVDVRTYKIIYEVIDDVRRAMEGMLKPIYKEKTIGKAEVREVFSSSRFGSVAGIYVLKGRIARGSKVHLFRGGEKIFSGGIASLRRFKDDVKEIEKEYEGGIVLEGCKGYKKGDIIESYVLEEEKRKL